MYRVNLENKKEFFSLGRRDGTIPNKRVFLFILSWIGKGVVGPPSFY